MMSFYDQFGDVEKKLLRARAERAALTNDTSEVLSSIDTLVVTLGEERYGLPLRALTAVYQTSTPVVPVPCTRPFIAGIANIRGHVVPVIDLAVLLGITVTATSAMAGIVIVSKDDMTLAFRVSTVDDAILLRVGEMVPVPELFDLAKKAYVQGALADGTILLNLDAILSDPALMVEEI